MPKFDNTFNWGHIVSGVMMALAIGGLMYTRMESGMADKAVTVKVVEQLATVAESTGKLKESVSSLSGVVQLQAERQENQTRAHQALRDEVTDHAKQIANSRVGLADIRARSGLPFNDGKN